LSRILQVLFMLFVLIAVVTMPPWGYVLSAVANWNIIDFVSLSGVSQQPDWLVLGNDSIRN
jgi:hypothetical protein